MPHAYTEAQLVERPAIAIFAAMGWRTVSAAEELLGTTGTLGSETTAEVVLTSHLRAALSKLNPSLADEVIVLAVEALARDRSAMSPAAANRDVYDLLKEGIQVSVPDRVRGGQKTERVKVIDWRSPAANDFLLVSPDLSADERDEVKKVARHLLEPEIRPLKSAISLSHHPIT